MSNILKAALAYAAHGWAVFPVPPGTKRSYKSAEHSDGRAWGMTRNAEEIRRDFTRWPDAGIGIPTGAVNGIIVVETDTVAGHGIELARTIRSQPRRFARHATGDQSVWIGASILQASWQQHQD